MDHSSKDSRSISRRCAQRNELQQQLETLRVARQEVDDAIVCLTKYLARGNNNRITMLELMAEVSNSQPITPDRATACPFSPHGKRPNAFSRRPR
jgi:hypothetical protein